MKFYRAIFIIGISAFLLYGRNANAQRTATYYYVSDNIQTWVVPNCVSQVTVQLWAGGGASGNFAEVPNFENAGGSGSYYEGVLSGLTPGTMLDLYVPSGGGVNPYDCYAGGAGGWPGGGNGASPSNDYPYCATQSGGGGGYAAIQINGTYYVVAGAGGGAGAGLTPFNAHGGTGGATTGGNGGYTNYPPGGGGGSLVAGGKVGYGGCFPCDTATTGSAFQGGNGGGYYENYPGGGGGGGYYGGGGGGHEGNGGGGGSSFPANTFTSGGITFTRLSNLQGNAGNSDSIYWAPGFPPNDSIGEGGFACNGGNGLIIINYGANSPFQVLAVVQTNPTCGVCNGVAGASASGGDSPYNYSWNPGGETTQTATGLCTRTYTVTVTDSCDNTSSAAVTLTSVPLSVSVNVTSQDKCNGNCNGSATATVAIGVPPYTYFWAPSGGSDATASGLCAGNYTVVVQAEGGCSGTASITITQPPALTTSASVAANVSCHGGSNGSAIATPSGGISPYTYSWAPIGGTNATGTGFAIGTYTVTITDSYGCTATAFVSITQPILLTATIKPPTDISCNGFNNGAATVVAKGGASPYTYSWSPSGGSDTTAANLSATIYTITVTDHNGCTATADVSITQPTALTANISGAINVTCNGNDNGSANVNAVGGTPPYTYLWAPSGGTNLTGTGFAPGTYTVTVTDNHGCKDTADVTITEPTTLTAKMGAYNNISCSGDLNGSATVIAAGGSTPYTYSWNPSGGSNAKATGLSSGTYTVTITDNEGCTKIASVTITQPANPLTITATGPPSDCYNNPITLTSTASGGTLPYTYHWMPGGGNNAALITKPLITTLYTITVTDGNGCTATATWSVYVAPLYVTITGADTAICPGQSITLSADGSGGYGTYHYLWLPSNLTTPSVTFKPTQDTTLTVEVTDGCDSQMASQTITVNVIPLPKVSFTGNILKGCVPLCIQFYENGNSGSITQWYWNFGNRDTSTMKNPQYCYNTPGNYSVSLTETSNIGCSSTFAIQNMITAYSNPRAAFTFSPQPTTIADPTIQFTDESTDAYGIISRLWGFGAGTDSTSKLENPSYTYKDTGMYCASLIVMNEHGCMDTTTNCLVIAPAFTLYIPSAFTPNGDGLNDVFMPQGQYIKTFEMYIFDRWGMQLFYTNNINEGWNGTVHGGSTVVQEDTYIYKIQVTDTQDNQHSYVGNVTVIK